MRWQEITCVLVSLCSAPATAAGAGEGVKCESAGHDDKNSPESCHAAMLPCQGDTTMLYDVFFFAFAFFLHIYQTHV